MPFVEKTQYYDFHGLLTMKVVRKDSSLNSFLSRLEKDYSFFRVKENLPNPDLLVFVGAFSPQNTECYFEDAKYYVKKDYLFKPKDSHKLAKWGVEISGLDVQKTIVKINSKIR